MSSQPQQLVHWLCPSCDAEPAVGDVENPLCPECGARLIRLRPRGRDRTGEVIADRFEIRDLLGEGGMGSVYRAWQRSIGRELAIKLIDERHGRDPMSVRRFLREARLASQLSQPNTISIFDFGQAGDGSLYIAMELIRGRTLAAEVEASGPFPVARVAWIGVQLCDALEAAHRLNIVHRDLKPANVVVLDDPPGRDLIKVLDFGLAKSLTDSETHDTDTGLVVGTPRYMAPEVVMGEGPTPQSDLYAVGVILGELALGKAMWDATSFPALAGQKLAGSPVLGEVPARLRPVVAALIDPERTHRPQSAAVARALLRPLMNATGSVPVPAVRPMIDGDADTQSSEVSPRLTGPTLPLAPTTPLQIARPLDLEGEAGRAGARPASAGDDDRAGDDDGAGDGDDDRDRADTGDRDGPAAASTPGVPAADSLTGGRVAAVLDDDAVVADPPGRGARRGRVIVAAAVAAAAALAVIVVAGRSGSSGDGTATTARPGSGSSPGPAGPAPVAIDAGHIATPAPPVDAAPASPPVDAAPIPTVVLTLRSRPDHLPVTIDGRDAGTTPTEVEVPASTTAVEIEVRQGRRHQRQRVIPDRPRTVELVVPRATGTRPSGLPF